MRRAVDDDFEPQATRAAAARHRRRRRREGRPGERGLTRGGASGAVVALVVPERREEPRANRARELGLVRPGVVRREGDVEGVGRGGAGDGETRRVVSRHRRIRRRRAPDTPPPPGGAPRFPKRAPAASGRTRGRRTARARAWKLAHPSKMTDGSGCARPRATRPREGGVRGTSSHDGGTRNARCRGAAESSRPRGRRARDARRPRARPRAGADARRGRGKATAGSRGTRIGSSATGAVKCEARARIVERWRSLASGRAEFRAGRPAPAGGSRGSRWSRARSVWLSSCCASHGAMRARARFRRGRASRRPSDAAVSLAVARAGAPSRSLRTAVRARASSVEEAFERCGRFTRASSATFYFATLLMRPTQRRSVWAIYAWCRVLDETVDGVEAANAGSAAASARLDAIEKQLVRLFEPTDEDDGDSERRGRRDRPRLVRRRRARRLDGRPRGDHPRDARDGARAVPRHDRGHAFRSRRRTPRNRPRARVGTSGSRVFEIRLLALRLVAVPANVLLPRRRNRGFDDAPGDGRRGGVLRRGRRLRGRGPRHRAPAVQHHSRRRARTRAGAASTSPRTSSATRDSRRRRSWPGCATSDTRR